LKPEWLEEGIIPTTPEGIEDNIVQGQHQAYLGKPSTESFELAPLDPQLLIVDQILQANQTLALLEEQQSWAIDNMKPDWTLEEGHLLYKNQLVVPDEEDLHT
jgi:hypothetical protein